VLRDLSNRREESGLHASAPSREGGYTRPKTSYKGHSQKPAGRPRKNMAAWHTQQ
jgi:hypothetical protein